MANLIEGNADDEMLRYEEAYNVKTYSGLTPETLRGGIVQHDSRRGVDVVFAELPSGGSVRIGERQADPASIAQTDVEAMAQEQVAQAQDGIESVVSAKGPNAMPTMDDYLAAGYTEQQVRDFEAQRMEQFLQGEGAMASIQDPVTLTPDQIQQYADQPGAETVAPREQSLRDRVQMSIFNAMDATEEPQSDTGQFILEKLQALTGSDLIDPEDKRFWANYLTDLVDIAVPGVGGAISADEGMRMFTEGWNNENPVDMLIGGALTGLGVAEIVPIVKKLSGPAREALQTMSPAAKNILADAIGASRAIAQGDKEMLLEVFQPSRPPQSLSAAGVGDAPSISLKPATDAPSVGGLAPQYRVVVDGFAPEGKGTQSFIPQQMTPKNRDAADEKLSVLTAEFPDPLGSPETYAAMMARVRNTGEVPAPPYWMIEHANDTDKWAEWFKGLTPDQIKAADEGLAVQEQFRAAYADPTTGPELTGQLMFWSIMSRMLSAFPHESGFLELAQSADPFIRKALAGEWSDATTAEWRKMVSETIPTDSPGRSATSNANAFGETFLRKMSVMDESGKSALERLHDMIADQNKSSAEIRRGYYGLAEQTGIGNKILSFALLVSGRNDVVVLDRIQINRMWGGGDKIYDDIMKQFEGAQGLAQYEALERSLAGRVGEMYQKAGRDNGSVGRYHWESWVLSSGQVVSHPTLEAVVRAGTPNVARNAPPTSGTPVMEGRFHTKYSGVKYEKLADGGNRYIYSTSTGEPYQFTKAQLDGMFDEAFKKKSGVLPPDFPGVRAFEGGNIPWYEFRGVDRGKLDDLIRKSGKPAER